MSVNEEFSAALSEKEHPSDESLKRMNREQVLSLPSFERLRWFNLLQINHPELQRVILDILELLQGDEGTRIVSLVGMTGAGKTTAKTAIGNALTKFYSKDATGTGSDIACLSISAPANGEKSLSWRVFYKRLLQSGGIRISQRHKSASISEGRIEYNRSMYVADLREFLEDTIKARRIRVLIIDEAFHLMRFGATDYTAVMDTLKSLADIQNVKLLLVGNYDLADLMIDYAQVARRTEIIHFQSYLCLKKTRLNQPVEFRPPPVKPKAGDSSDEYEFYSVVSKYQRNWPSKKVPDLCAMWWPLMLASVGSVGLLKITLDRLAYLQMKSPDESITREMLRKMAKNQSALDKIYRDLRDGTEKVENVTYGSATACAVNHEQFLQIIGGHDV